MTMHILIHKTRIEDANEVSWYLANRLNELYPNKVKTYHDGQLITVNYGSAYIEVRCGEDPYKLGALLPDFYYTNSDRLDVLEMIEQSASKCNGKRIYTLDRVIRIIGFYMEMLEKIDQYLKESED